MLIKTYLRNLKTPFEILYGCMVGWERIGVWGPGYFFLPSLVTRMDPNGLFVSNFLETQTRLFGIDILSQQKYRTVYKKLR